MCKSSNIFLCCSPFAHSEYAADTVLSDRNISKYSRMVEKDNANMT